MRCICGKLIEFWSGLLNAGFCSDKCYEKARANAKPIDVDIR